jgi:Flp pilus assembly protein TadG
LLGERRSSAAVEFALTVPILILLGLGAIEFSAAVRAQLNVNRTARYVADILQNQTSVSSAQMQDYYVAAQDMYANGGADGTLSLSAGSVNFTNTFANNTWTTTAKIGWDASTAPAGVTTPAYTPLPANTLTANNSDIDQLSDSRDADSTIIVVASAVFTLPFMPDFYGKIPTSFTFTAFARVRPRYVLQIPTNPSTGF